MAENKIEQYLIDLKFNYEEVKPGFWLIDDREHDLEGMVVMYSEPLVIIEVHVMNIPKQGQLEFCKKLLELNSGEMIHGAYGLEGDKVVIIASLEYETLNYEAFRSVLDGISLALTQHYPILSVYLEK